MSRPRPCCAWPSSACRPTPARPLPRADAVDEAVDGLAELADAEAEPRVAGQARERVGAAAGGAGAAAVAEGGGVDADEAGLGVERGGEGLGQRLGDRVDERRELGRAPARGAERLAQEARDVDVEEAGALLAHRRARLLELVALGQRRALRGVDRGLQAVLAAEHDRVADDAGRERTAVLRRDAVGDAAVRALARAGQDAAQRRGRRGVVARGGDDDLVALLAERQRGRADAVAEPRLDVARELHAALVEEGDDLALRVGRAEDLPERGLGVLLLLPAAARRPPRRRPEPRPGRRRPGPIRCRRPTSRRIRPPRRRRSRGPRESGGGGGARGGGRWSASSRHRSLAAADDAPIRAPGGLRRTEPRVAAAPTTPHHAGTSGGRKAATRCKTRCSAACRTSSCAISRPGRRPSPTARSPMSTAIPGRAGSDEERPWEKMCRMGCLVGGCGVEVSAADRGGGAPPTPPPRSASTFLARRPSIERPGAHLATRGTRDDRWPSAAPSTTPSTRRTG